MTFAKGTKTAIDTTEQQIKKMLQKAGAEGTAFMEERRRAASPSPILADEGLAWEAARNWANARLAFLTLPSGSPDAKLRLNELSEAEDALQRALQTRRTP